MSQLAQFCLGQLRKSAQIGSNSKSSLSTDNNYPRSLPPESKVFSTLIERALSRQPLTDWKDAISPEEEAIINRLSADLREAYPKMEPDEIYRCSELSHQCGDAQLAISELMRLAADKAELEERGDQ